MHLAIPVDVVAHTLVLPTPTAETSPDDVTVATLVSIDSHFMGESFLFAERVIL